MMTHFEDVSSIPLVLFPLMCTSPVIGRNMNIPCAAARRASFLNLIAGDMLARVLASVTVDGFGP